MQIKTTMKYHFTNCKMTPLKKTQIIKSVNEDVEKLDPHTLLMGMSHGVAVENNLAVPQQVKPCSQAILLLGVY